MYRWVVRSQVQGMDTRVSNIRKNNRLKKRDHLLVEVEGDLTLIPSTRFSAFHEFEQGCKIERNATARKSKWSENCERVERIPDTRYL